MVMVSNFTPSKTVSVNGFACFMSSATMPFTLSATSWLRASQVCLLKIIKKKKSDSRKFYCNHWSDIRRYTVAYYYKWQTRQILVRLTPLNINSYDSDYPKTMPLCCNSNTEQPCLLVKGCLCKRTTITDKFGINPPNSKCTTYPDVSLFAKHCIMYFIC